MQSPSERIELGVTGGGDGGGGEGGGVGNGLGGDNGGEGGFKAQMQCLSILFLHVAVEERLVL